MAHSCGGSEVVGVDLQGFMAVANRIAVSSAGEAGDGPLIPSLSQGGGILDQLTCPLDGFFVMLSGIEACDDRQLLAFGFTASAVPDVANAVFGQEPHGAVVV